MEQFKDFMNNAWQFLNDPLPVVGVSVLFLLIFAFKIFKSTSFGKKAINKIKQEFAEHKAKTEQIIQQQNAEIERVKAENEKLKAIIYEMASLTPNKKVQAVKDKVYEEETTDSQTEAQ